MKSWKYWVINTQFDLVYLIYSDVIYSDNK